MLLTENRWIHLGTNIFNALKAAFAFAEVGASPKEYHIDLANKPAWYTEKVNPTGKVIVVKHHCLEFTNVLI